MEEENKNFCEHGHEHHNHHKHNHHNENCHCNCDEHLNDQENIEEKKCNCGCEDKNSEEKCECGCECEEGCGEDCQCGCQNDDKAGQYLALAQRLQADFDNYRKHVAEQLDYQRNEGIKSVIEVFLPCLDTFKEAKKTISDEKVLAGVNMIEEKINNALKSLKVEKIDAVGQKFDHNLHEAIAFMKDESKENDIILEEFQAGYKFNGKVIRYSKVIINKRED